MSKVYDMGDTIAAISTPAGMGGIGIVRLSGPDALVIADQVFAARKGQKPSTFSTYTVHYGDIFQNIDGKNESIDEALLTVMRAPKSYTCEDVVEFSCHGGTAAVNVVLQLCLKHGARLAHPGEFTKRAFLNGRIDLAQAEAVLDVIRAKTATGLSVSEHQLKGELTLRLEEIRRSLMEIYVELEAAVNFPEDDERDDSSSVFQLLAGIADQIKSLLATADQGRILREGIKVVLCGKPNVGKSSLLNQLLRQPRAIVSHIEGTTRDAIEETAQIEGVPFQMVDTAGILDPRDEIEEQAVKRSHLHIEKADLVLLLLDASDQLSQQDRELAQKLQDQDVLIVLNKTDLNNVLSRKDVSLLLPNKDIVRVSALSGQGIEGLRQKILMQVLHGSRIEEKNILLSNVRHIDLLSKCLQEVDQASCCQETRTPPEFISEYIKSAVQQLDRITGRDLDSDLVDQIFSSFCIGK